MIGSYMVEACILLFLLYYKITEIAREPNVSYRRKPVREQDRRI